MRRTTDARIHTTDDRSQGFGQYWIAGYFVVVVVITEHPSFHHNLSFIDHKYTASFECQACNYRNFSTLVHIVAELWRKGTVIFTSRDNALDTASPCFNLTCTEEGVGNIRVIRHTPM